MSFKYTEFLSAGKTVEEKLSQSLKRLMLSSRKEDLNGVDLKLTLTFDLKTAKKIRRNDMAPSYTKTWIEYKNVKGELGSICKPDLDFFLIEGLEYWHVKSREDTLQFFLQQCTLQDGYKQLQTLNSDSKIDLYQPYQRDGRKDVIMLVEVNHPSWPTLMKISKESLTVTQ